MKRGIVWHPVLLAAYPALFLYSHNISECSLGTVIWPLMVTVALTAVVWLLLGWGLRSFQKAGLMASLAVVMFFTYGLCYKLAPQFRVSLFGRVFGPSIVVMPLWGILGLAGVILLIRTKRHLTIPTKLLNACSLGIVILALFTIVPTELHRLTRAPEPLAPVPTITLTPEEIDALPNIYHITLDAYARADTLADLYGYNNRAFLTALKKRGFFIADRARSNYWGTVLSVPSALNMNYLDDFAKRVGPDAQDKGRAAQLSRTSAAIRTLRSCGYKVILFHTGIPPIESIEPDRYMVRSRLLSPSQFTEELLSTTAMPVLTSALMDTSKSGHRRRAVTYTLDHLDKTCEMGGPLFVIAHIMLPHEPFMFGPKGEPRAIRWSSLPPDEYRRLYRDQVTYLNTRILSVIDAIIAKSSKPPIIVMAADHGPRSIFDEGGGEKNSPAALRERFRILNAYLLPGGASENLYPDITPVNSYRVIFNHYFKTSYPLLPDRSFLSDNRHPFKFVDVTDIVTGKTYPQDISNPVSQPASPGDSPQTDRPTEQ